MLVLHGAIPSSVSVTGELVFTAGSTRVHAKVIIILALNPGKIAVLAVGIVAHIK